MKRLPLLAATLAMIATTALANGLPPSPTPDPTLATDEEMAARARAGHVSAADTCTVPTSTPPAGYAPDAKTWPCKNFAKH